MNTTNFRSKKSLVLISGLVFIVIALILVLFVFNIPERLRNIQLERETKQFFTNEYKVLGNPLESLGFDNIEYPANTACGDDAMNFGSTGYSCSTTLKAYQVFSTDEQKTKAIEAAKMLNQNLQANNWMQREEPELQVETWFKDVLNGKDWYPDALSYKKGDPVHCTLDFFVAYSNPATPAVQAMYVCSNPGSLPF